LPGSSAESKEYQQHHIGDELHLNLRASIFLHLIQIGLVKPTMIQNTDLPLLVVPSQLQNYLQASKVERSKSEYIRNVIETRDK